MIPRHCIYLALLVVAIIATTGCTTNGGTLDNVYPASAHVNRDLVGEECINMSVALPSRLVFDIPLPRSGTSYHVVAKTITYDHVIYGHYSYQNGHYSYQTTSQYTDRFGVHNTTTVYKDVALEGGDYYLGVSNNNRVIDTVIKIPSGAEDPKLFFVHSEFDGELYSNFDVSVTEVAP